MDLQTAMLCEAATVRDGLLYILGGGVSTYTVAQYPTPLGVSLAVLIELDYLDQGEPHGFRITLLDAEACELGRAEGEFATMVELDLNVVATLPAAIPLAGMTLPAPGNYEIRLEIDGNTRARLPLESRAG